jgi:hypothetical protein
MMDELIERLEKATGPDRELDGAIALSLGWTFQKMKGDSKPYYRKPGETTYYMRSEVPAYTASIDAALTLGVGQWKLRWQYHGMGNWVAAAEVTRSDNFERWYDSDYQDSPAIALCIAALRARA